MTTYARIADGAVAELFTPPDGFSITDCFAPGMEWVDVGSSGAAPGWTYDGTAFHAPAPPAPPAPITTMSPLEFMARFTANEQTAIATAAQANASVLLWMLKLSGATFVDLADPQTKAGIDALVTAGLLTAERETAILTP
jgi:hypothetical protein